MFCPSCSAPAAEGAKFCKACGFSLTVVTNALSGSAPSDPLRDREYKRARKQITDGIQGSAIGAALGVGAVVAYMLLPRTGAYYAVSLALALLGVIKLFKSIGHIIDAKVGPRLLGAELQPRSSGGLANPQPLPAAPPTTRVSQRLAVDQTTPVTPAKEAPPAYPGQVPGTSRVGTGRVYREHSTPLRKPDKESDVFSKLRS